METIIGKQPLSEVQQIEATRLAAWAGQLMLQHGAETDLVERTVHRLATA